MGRLMHLTDSTSFIPTMAEALNSVKLAVAAPHDDGIHVAALNIAFQPHRLTMLCRVLALHRR